MDKRGGNTVKDLMLSYSPDDTDLVLRIRDRLVKHGLSVWIEESGTVSGAEHFQRIGHVMLDSRALQRIGQAVVDCGLFVFVMSLSSVKSKFCQDQLALACVSGKPIVPLALNPFSELRDLMTNGMKLQLARFSSIPIQMETLETVTEELAEMLHDELNKMKIGDRENVDKEEERPNLQQQHTLGRMTISRKNADEWIDNPKLMEKPDVFWKRHFEDESVVAWDRFVVAMTGDFREELDQKFGQNDTEWLIDILQRGLVCEQNESLTKDNFLDFCTVDQEKRPLWLMVKEQALESYAIREVFEMNSTVRVQAIQNLGKFKSVGVINKLRDLLYDRDSNIRAVAIISLAKTGANDGRTIKRMMKCLESKDRLVREASCLALGHLKAVKATEKIVDLWRNDKISNVREAAFAALEKIGGKQAAEAVRITKVLEKQIRHLKSNPARPS